MSEMIAMVVEMITKCLREHGFLKTCYALMGILLFFTVLILAWQAPEIIRALQGR